MEFIRSIHVPGPAVNLGFECGVIGLDELAGIATAFWIAAT